MQIKSYVGKLKYLSEIFRLKLSVNLKPSKLLFCCVLALYFMPHEAVVYTHEKIY